MKANRPFKSKRKRHSCAQCKPHKTGGAPARTVKDRSGAREALKEAISYTGRVTQWVY